MDIVNTRKRELIYYLDHYTTKDIKIKEIIFGIRSRLIQYGHLTRNQLGVLLPFLERETKFRSLKRKDIVAYFKPLITPKSKGRGTYANPQTHQF